jgi:hypothetical protein
MHSTDPTETHEPVPIKFLHFFLMDFKRSAPTRELNDDVDVYLYCAKTLLLMAEFRFYTLTKLTMITPPIVSAQHWFHISFT